MWTSGVAGKSSCSSLAPLWPCVLLGLVISIQTASGYPKLFDTNNKSSLQSMLTNIRNMEAQLLRQQLASSSRMSLKPDPTARVDDQGDVDDEEADDRDGIPEPARRVGYGNYQQRTLNMNNIRRLRNNFRKRNYNLDHLARMNFRRSFRASSFNNRHILGGL